MEAGSGGSLALVGVGIDRPPPKPPLMGRELGLRIATCTFLRGPGTWVAGPGRPQVEGEISRDQTRCPQTPQPSICRPARAGCQGVQSSLEGDRLASVWPGASLPSFVPVTDHPGHLLAPTVQMGRLRLRAGDGQGQAAALVKSPRSEMGLAWILASPPNPAHPCPCC